MHSRPPRSTLFAYTTLFRSQIGSPRLEHPQQPYQHRSLSWQTETHQHIGTHPSALQHGCQLISMDIELMVAQLLPLTERCQDRKSTRLNSSHSSISYAVFCL